jgi:hypothetical protein
MTSCATMWSPGRQSAETAVAEAIPLAKASPPRQGTPKLFGGLPVRPSYGCKRAR